MMINDNLWSHRSARYSVAHIQCFPPQRDGFTWFYNTFVVILGMVYYWVCLIDFDFEPGSKKLLQFTTNEGGFQFWQGFVTFLGDSSPKNLQGLLVQDWHQPQRHPKKVEHDRTLIYHEAVGDWPLFGPLKMLAPCGARCSCAERTGHSGYQDEGLLLQELFMACLYIIYVHNIFCLNIWHMNII